MNYYLFVIEVIVGVLALFLLWKGIGYFYRMWRYKKLLSMPFPQRYVEILENLALYRNLPLALKKKLHLLILLFIEQKEFIPVKIIITDEIKVIIAFYASVIRLGFALDEKDLSSTIIVYPQHFVVNDTSEDGGIYHDRDLMVQGQSAKGTVVLSWQDIQEDMREEGKENVIIHEFAHELDFEDGYADGTPVLEGSHYQRWSEVFSSVFDGLKDMANTGKSSEESSFLGSYALTNEAEFFAVCSERFFQTPKAFQEAFPEIFKELSIFYRLNPMKDL